MNSRVLVVGLISIVVFGTFLFKDAKNGEIVVQGVQNQDSSNKNIAATVSESLTKSMGAVEVEVTPINLGSDSNMTFDLALNTHSVELSYNYTKIIKAEDNFGNQYKVISWSGGEGGHHLSGQVELEPISKSANKIMLIIDGIDDEIETFEWSI